MLHILLSHQLIGNGQVLAIPDLLEVPPDGLNLRWPDDRWSQDHRLQNYKGYAAIAFGRANGVDRTVFDCPSPRLGVVASGKARAKAWSVPGRQAANR